MKCSHAPSWPAAHAQARARSSRWSDSRYLLTSRGAGFFPANAFVTLRSSAAAKTSGGTSHRSARARRNSRASSRISLPLCGSRNLVQNRRLRLVFLPLLFGRPDARGQSNQTCRLITSDSIGGSTTGIQENLMFSYAKITTAITRGGLTFHSCFDRVQEKTC